MHDNGYITELPRPAMNNIVPQGIPVVGAWLNCAILIFPNEALVEIVSDSVTNAKAALRRASLPVNGPRAGWSTAQREVHQSRIVDLTTKYLNAVANRNELFGVHLEGRVLRVTEGRFAA